MAVEQRVVVKRWFLNGVNLRQAAPRAQMLMASSELFVHSSYLGKEAEFLPAGKQAFEREGFARLHKERVCPWEQVSGICLKTSISREFWAPSHGQDSL